MHIDDHCKASLERFGNDYREVHKWLDFFDCKKGRIRDREYDYTGANCIKHRQERHHVEGIRECVEFFISVYGKDVAKEIREAAELHIFQDFSFIPFKSDYKQIGFWRDAGERFDAYQRSKGNV